MLRTHFRKLQRNPVRILIKRQLQRLEGQLFIGKRFVVSVHRIEQRDVLANCRNSFQPFLNREIAPVNNFRIGRRCSQTTLSKSQQAFVGGESFAKLSAASNSGRFLN